MAINKASEIEQKAILEITHRTPGITRTILLYRLLQITGLPFVFFYFLFRLAKNPLYRPEFRERLGFLPQRFSRTDRPGIWFHAVSVGEVASAVPLVRAIRSSEPGIPIYLSTSTIAGRQAARRQVSQDVDRIFYSPIDYRAAVTRVLRTIRPALVVILETEIWPNLYYESKRAGAQVIIVNGRISDRTWPRYSRWKSLFGPILQIPDTIYAQSMADRLRYVELGADSARVMLAGNLKYDASLARAAIQFPLFGAEQVWIASSTTGPNERGSIKPHQVDEDDIVLRVFASLVAEFSNLLLILAPRQPERFEHVAEKLRAAGLRSVRRSEMGNGALPDMELPGVVLLDTIGELGALYRLSDVVFVGGSIAPRGGHNIIEPAAAGVPVVVGPHMENFQGIARDFLEADALIQIQNPGELESAIRELLRDARRRQQIGSRARQTVAAKRGVARAIGRELIPRYYAATPKLPKGLLARIVLCGLAYLWREGGLIKRLRGERVAQSRAPLRAPVISIGGITIGGSGKTPFTRYVADRLGSRGYSPAILTRGYKRRSPATLILPPGGIAPAAFTGDEAQTFLRAGVAALGIGADRYETAQVLLEELPETDILVLDDGFQHARMKRDFDVVVIDGLDPFGGDEVVPFGRLREPLEALERADAFVITRAENPARFEAIRKRLSELNPRAPAFRTRLVTRCWHDYRTKDCLSRLNHRKVGAFCGLGNPESFWRTLEALDLDLVFRWAFPDHHVYKPKQIEYLARRARLAGAGVLVTTEKDRMNFPHHLEKALAQVEIAWLEIQVELENESAFFTLLEQTLRARRAA